MKIHRPWQCVLQFKSKHQIICNLEDKMLAKILFISSLLVISAVHAEGLDEELEFKKNTSSAVKKGCVVGADIDKYTLEARPGQKMSVSISSEEDNASFNLYYQTEENWDMIAGADADDGVKQWTGRLPAGTSTESNSYRIEVGKQFGNACYTLKVSIK